MNPIASMSLSRLVLGACLLGAVLTASAADSGAQKISQSQKTGPYTLRLEILPPEPFVSPDQAGLKKSAGEMVNGRGAAPIQKGGPKHPNHHLAVFVMRGGHVVEDALVHVRYRKSGSKQTHSLPVTAMWVAGKPRYKTTHFGNNVYLADKPYDVEVQLNHRKPLVYHINLGPSAKSSQS